jgi:hypothetical protein
VAFAVGVTPNIQNPGTPPMITKVAVFVMVAGAAIAVEEAKRAKARMAVDNVFIKKILW